MDRERRLLVSLTLALILALTLGLQPCLAQAAAPDQASTSRASAALDSMPKAKKIDTVAISPDGAQVAYIVGGALSVANRESGESHQIKIDSEMTLRAVSWSSDSSHIAFLADVAGDAPSAQVWTASADGGNAKRHAELKGYVDAPRFSPSGNELSVLFIENMPRVAGPLQPMTPLAGEISKAVYEQRLSLIDLASDQLHALTPADVYIYEYDWAPDGKSIAAIAAHGNGDANWWVAKLFRINAKSGEMSEIYKPKLQIADPHVSPDSTSVAFIEGLMSDAGLTGGDVETVPLAGGAMKNLTAGGKTSPSGVAWGGDGRVLFTDDADGNSAIGEVSPGEKAKTIWHAEETIGLTTQTAVPQASFSRDGSQIAVVRQSAGAPSEVWAGAPGKWKQLTQVNAGLKPAWGEMRNIHWSNGKTQVQGWLMLPKNYDDTKQYPLVVNVHGGPSWACTSRWDEEVLGPQSAMGYFAFCPNPRGSFGQGEAFTQGNVKDFGGGDFKDIMAGVDAIAKAYPIDQKRIALRGHSYGGYMAMWAETQTARFAAIVAGAGICDWLSYYGLNDIDEWMVPFFGASIYKDQAAYAKSEPMRFVKAVKTPTLILVGDRDGEVPMEQSVEWWHALDAMNVPVKLVVYPNEGHLFIKPADARDYTLRGLEWFDEWFSKAEEKNGGVAESNAVR